MAAVNREWARSPSRLRNPGPTQQVLLVGSSDGPEGERGRWDRGTGGGGGPGPAQPGPGPGPAAGACQEPPTPLRTPWYAYDNPAFETDSQHTASGGGAAAGSSPDGGSPPQHDTTSLTNTTTADAADPAGAWRTSLVPPPPAPSMPTGVADPIGRAPRGQAAWQLPPRPRSLQTEPWPPQSGWTSQPLPPSMLPQAQSQPCSPDDAESWSPAMRRAAAAADAAAAAVSSAALALGWAYAPGAPGQQTQLPGGGPRVVEPSDTAAELWDPSAQAAGPLDARSGRSTSGGSAPDGRSSPRPDLGYLLLSSAGASLVSLGSSDGGGAGQQAWKPEGGSGPWTGVSTDLAAAEAEAGPAAAASSPYGGLGAAADAAAAAVAAAAAAAARLGPWDGRWTGHHIEPGAASTGSGSGLGCGEELEGEPKGGLPGLIRDSSPRRGGGGSDGVSGGGGDDDCGGGNMIADGALVVSSSGEWRLYGKAVMATAVESCLEAAKATERKGAAGHSAGAWTPQPGPLGACNEAAPGHAALRPPQTAAPHADEASGRANASPVMGRMSVRAVALAEGAMLPPQQPQPLCCHGNQAPGDMGPGLDPGGIRVDLVAEAAAAYSTAAVYNRFGDPSEPPSPSGTLSSCGSVRPPLTTTGVMHHQRRHPQQPQHPQLQLRAQGSGSAAGALAGPAAAITGARRREGGGSRGRPEAEAAGSKSPPRTVASSSRIPPPPGLNRRRHHAFQRPYPAAQLQDSRQAGLPEGGVLALGPRSDGGVTSAIAMEIDTEAAADGRDRVCGGLGGGAGAGKAGAAARLIRSDPGGPVGAGAVGAGACVRGGAAGSAARAGSGAAGRRGEVYDRRQASGGAAGDEDQASAAQPRQLPPPRRKAAARYHQARLPLAVRAAAAAAVAARSEALRRGFLLAADNDYNDPAGATDTPHAPMGNDSAYLAAGPMGCMSGGGSECSFEGSCRDVFAPAFVAPASVAPASSLWDSNPLPTSARGARDTSSTMPSCSLPGTARRSLYSACSRDSVAAAVAAAGHPGALAELPSLALITEMWYPGAAAAAAGGSGLYGPSPGSSDGLMGSRAWSRNPSVMSTGADPSGGFGGHLDPAPSCSLSSVSWAQLRQDADQAATSLLTYPESPCGRGGGSATAAESLGNGDSDGSVRLGGGRRQQRRPARRGAEGGYGIGAAGIVSESEGLTLASDGHAHGQDTADFPDDGTGLGGSEELGWSPTGARTPWVAAAAATAGAAAAALDAATGTPVGPYVSTSDVMGVFGPGPASSTLPLAALSPSLLVVNTLAAAEAASGSAYPMLASGPGDGGISASCPFATTPISPEMASRLAELSVLTSPSTARTGSRGAGPSSGLFGSSEPAAPLSPGQWGPPVQADWRSDDSTFTPDGLYDSQGASACASPSSESCGSSPPPPPPQLPPLLGHGGHRHRPPAGAHDQAAAQQGGEDWGGAHDEHPGEYPGEHPAHGADGAEEAMTYGSRRELGEWPQSERCTTAHRSDDVAAAAAAAAARVAVITAREASRSWFAFGAGGGTGGAAPVASTPASASPSPCPPSPAPERSPRASPAALLQAAASAFSPRPGPLQAAASALRNLAASVASSVAASRSRRASDFGEAMAVMSASPGLASPALSPAVLDAAWDSNSTPSFGDSTRG